MVLVLMFLGVCFLGRCFGRFGRGGLEVLGGRAGGAGDGGRRGLEGGGRRRRAAGAGRASWWEAREKRRRQPAARLNTGSLVGRAQRSQYHAPGPCSDSFLEQARPLKSAGQEA